MIDVNLSSFPLILSLMIFASILAFLLALGGIRKQHFHTVITNLFTAYFVCGLVSTLVARLMDVEMIDRNLHVQAVFFLLTGFLLLLAISIRARSKRFWPGLAALLLIYCTVLLWLHDMQATLFMVAAFDLSVFPIVAFLCFRRGWRYRNVGNVIMGAAASLEILPGPVLAGAALGQADISFAYSFVVAANSTAFLLVGIGFLTTVLIFERSKMRELALHDPLTGLFNRRGLEHALTIPLAQQKRSEKQVSAISADLDHFKAINDRHGHNVGDDVLTAFAKVLEDHVREGDVCCRLGGEEFVVVAFDATEEEALDMAERIRQHAECLLIRADSGAVRLTCSFGVATHKGQVDLDQLLKDADKALYRAKAQGRNRTCTVATVAS